MRSFFRQLAPHLRTIVPVKTDIGSFFLNAVSFDQRRQRARNAAEDGAVAAALLQLYLLPVLLYLMSIAGLDRAKHVRMTENQLGIESIGNIADVELPLLLPYF